MTTTLRVIVDDIIAPASGGGGRYAEELTRELIRTAPAGCEVSGVVSSSPEADYDALHTLLPGLSDLFKSALARRELQLAWQHGVIRLPGNGMVHAPSLLAPLARRDPAGYPGAQTVVTIHDAVAWTHPSLINPRRAAWQKSMAKRAFKYADAVVVPTHAVAHDLSEVFNFGDRIRVVGGAVSAKLTVPVDASDRADRLDLPERYLVSAGTVDARKGLEPLIRSLATAADAGLPLLIAGPDGWDGLDVEAITADAGLDPSRVRRLGRLSDADLAVVMSRAAVFAFPSLAEGFGLPLVEAFSLGTPVVHSDAPAVIEVAAGAGIPVPIADEGGYPERLAVAIASVVNDDSLAERLRFSGLDRAAAFSWRASAEQVWQLHADL
ncbi:glycosyltransferase family 4 protein [Marisediminicola antarctica]|uniref:Mannosyltransferase n=1 Tax=Marisediminicola antarctica TaxID=674079 RepID=A0A7L5ANZ5_9MICO|nr:glycosyltransferase family 1 protein [Marisediminicola antarctica]QHO70851.1 mannosyltransferase [Marisediminicola antarctica]